MKDEIKQKLLKFNTPRRIVQFMSFMFFSWAIFNLDALPVLLPILWTWGVEPNTVGDAFTALQYMLYHTLFPWLAIASFLITGVLIGKSLCGWVCPFGFIQDLVGVIRRKKMLISLRTHDTMVYLKYFFLGIALLVSVSFSAAKLMGTHESYERAFGVFAKVPFSTLSPSETLFGTLPRMIVDLRHTLLETPVLDVLSGIANLTPLFWVQLFIMVGVLILSAYIPRVWCRYFCPHAAIMALMNKFSFLGLRRDPVKCTKGSCRRCVEVCPMDIRILDLPWEKINDPECIYCMKCVDACSDKAITPKYP